MNEMIQLFSTEQLGSIFYIDFNKMNMFVTDSKKQELGGVSLNMLLLVKSRMNQDLIVCRVIDTCDMPQDKEIQSNLIEIFKGQDVNDSEDLDPLTKFKISGTAYSLKILGTLFSDEGKIKFGSDISNIYGPSQYTVYKPQEEQLEQLIKISAGFSKDSKTVDLIKYGVVRYSSSRQEEVTKVPFYINSKDLLSKRTAMFGMTRTGKSNSMKKLIQTVENLNKEDFPVGQIIFDINGEYANTNEQDGTSIYEKYKSKVKRYSLIEKEGFDTLKINFYNDIVEGFSLINGEMKGNSSVTSSDYFTSFLEIDLSKPEDQEDYSALTRYNRKLAVYKLILFKAQFTPPVDGKIIFTGFDELNNKLEMDPSKGVTYDEALLWFETLWKEYETISYLAEYPTKNKGKKWEDEDLKSLLVVLTGAKTPGGEPTVSGYKKLDKLKNYHSSSSTETYYKKIIRDAEEGNISIVDLSIGRPEIKTLYIQRLCEEIFKSQLNKFISGNELTHIQLYFEEAHNLFPRSDSDLTQIYNRLAKEGAKYKIGLVYATQEPSSISAAILKNTENFFISYLNSEDEIRCLSAYYDFKDFSTSLKQFSKSVDLGYSRVKMLSYPFTTPVQVDLFN